MLDNVGRNAWRWGRAVLATLALTSFASAGLAEDKYDPTLINCKIVYNIKGWSMLVKTAKGEGTITCDNGQKSEVALKSLGGGLTIGKSEIIGARGTFTPVRSIEDLYGTFAEAEAHAGATKSTIASVLTKGEISLAISGRGQGIDVGVSLGGFTISPM